MLEAMVVVVDVDHSRGRVTVTTLYLVPNNPLPEQILPKITVYPGVLERLCKGADLFMPGVVLDLNLPSSLGRSWVLHNFGRFAKGDLCSLVVQGHWAPMALLAWNLSWDELELKGREVGGGGRDDHRRRFGSIPLAPFPDPQGLLAHHPAYYR